LSLSNSIYYYLLGIFAIREEGRKGGRKEGRKEGGRKEEKEGGRKEGGRKKGCGFPFILLYLIII